MIRCPSCHGKGTASDPLQAVRKAIGGLSPKDIPDRAVFDRIKALYLDLDPKRLANAAAKLVEEGGKAPSKARRGGTAPPSPTDPLKPFVCPIEGKAFKTKRRLRRHSERIHPGKEIA